MKQNLWILGTWVLGWPLWNICVTNDHGYVPLVMNTFRSFPYSRLITRFVTRLTRRVPLVEQELLPLTRSLCTYFVDSCLSICTFSFGHCVLCSSSIYGFWLPPFGIFNLLSRHCCSYALWHHRGYDSVPDNLRLEYHAKSFCNYGMS